MSIWSKILVGFIAFATLGMMVLAAYTLKIHQAWQKAAKSYDAPLAQKAQENEDYLEGDVKTDPPKLGIRDLSVQLHSWMVDRGRVWQPCAMTGFDPASGNLAIHIESLEPTQIQEKMLLYVFAAPEAGGYLGEFSVKGIADKTLQLAPTMQLLQEKTFNEVARIQQAAQAQAPLTVYERMPADRHEAYAVFDTFPNKKEELEKWLPGLPAKVLDEFLRDGQTAGPDDDDERVVNGKYVRQLRDYAVFFHALHGQIIKLKDEIATATTDNAIAARTQKATEVQVQLRQKEIDEKLNPELKEVSEERDLIAKHDAALKARLTEVTQEEQQLLAKIEELNEELTDLQTRVAERLNELIETEEAAGQ